MSDDDPKYRRVVRRIVGAWVFVFVLCLPEYWNGRSDFRRRRLFHWLQIWIYAAIAVGLVLGTVWILDREYDRGYVAGRAIGDAAIAKVA